VSGTGISWNTRKSAPRSIQITMPVPHHSVFYSSDALPAAQPTASKHWGLNIHRYTQIYIPPKSWERIWRAEWIFSRKEHFKGTCGDPMTTQGDFVCIKNEGVPDNKGFCGSVEAASRYLYCSNLFIHWLHPNLTQPEITTSFIQGIPKLHIVCNSPCQCSGCSHSRRYETAFLENQNVRSLWSLGVMGNAHIMHLRNSVRFSKSHMCQG